MKLFWCPQTRAVRAIWLLEEARVDYERVLIDIRNPAAERDPDFAAASPMGKVPALKDGEVAIAESAAICLYVADRYPEAQLAPALDDSVRGAYLYWTIFAPAVIEPAMVEKFGGYKTNRGVHGWGDFDTMIETFEKGIASKEWLLGDRFSAADIMVGSSAVFLRQFEALPDSKTLQDYADRCLARPAYQRALEINQQPLPG